MSVLPSSEPEWVHGHPHEPNPAPPSSDPTLTVVLPNGSTKMISVADLARLPQHLVTDCYIVSTGHGRSGPFQFSGVRFPDLLSALALNLSQVQYIDVVAADGFGARLVPGELAGGPDGRPPLLALRINDRLMVRDEGLVRLITPNETDDALRQVKWVSQIIVKTDPLR